MKHFYRSFYGWSEREHRLVFDAETPEAPVSPDAAPTTPEAPMDPENAEEQKDEKVNAAQKLIDEVNKDVGNQDIATSEKIGTYHSEGMKKLNEDLNTDESKKKMEEITNVFTALPEFSGSEVQDAIGISIALLKDPSLQSNKDFLEGYPIAQKVIDSGVLTTGLDAAQKTFLADLGTKLDAVQVEQETKAEGADLSPAEQHTLVARAETQLSKLTPEVLDNMPPSEIQMKMGEAMKDNGVQVTLNAEKNGFNIIPPSKDSQKGMNVIMGYVTYFMGLAASLKSQTDVIKGKSGEKTNAETKAEEKKAQEAQDKADQEKAADDLSKPKEGGETPVEKSKREGMVHLAEFGVQPMPKIDDTDNTVYTLDAGDESSRWGSPEIRFTGTKWEMKGTEEDWSNEGRPYKEATEKTEHWNVLMQKLKDLNGSTTETVEKSETLDKDKDELKKALKEKITNKVTLLHDNEESGGYSMTPSSLAEFGRIEEAVNQKIEGATVIDPTIKAEIDSLIKDAAPIINKELQRLVEQKGEQYLKTFKDDYHPNDPLGKFINLTGGDDMIVKIDPERNGHWTYKEQDQGTFLDPSTDAFDWENSLWSNSYSEGKNISEKLAEFNKLYDDNKA